jgi:BMFP domain-containing protein YqiC
MMTGDPQRILAMQQDLAHQELVIQDLQARLNVNREALEICQTRRREETEALQARIAELEAKDEPNSKDAGGAAETGV